MKLSKIRSTVFERSILDNSGFTMIEVVAIVALVAMLTTFAVPDFIRLHDNYQLRISAQELANNIRGIQHRAITEGVSWRIVFNEIYKDRYQIVQGFNAKRVNLPPKVFIEHNSFDNVLEFKSSGAPNRGGHIVISNGYKKLYIILSVATGRIRIDDIPPR